MDPILIMSLSQYEKARSTELEYSCSIPTATTIGKKWLCNRNFDRRRTGGDPKSPQFSWLMCEYRECEPYNEKRVSIHRRPIIIAEALVLGALLQELFGVASPYGGLE